MRIKLGILCLALVVFDPLVGAFPSSGSNGIVNATILGTYRLDEQHIIVDILFPEDDPSFLCGILEGIALVDDDDKFYESNLDFNTQGVSMKYDILPDTPTAVAEASMRFMAFHKTLRLKKF